MSFNIQTPLSYVRSTNYDTPSVGERRRRPTFSLRLDIDTSFSVRAIHSQSTTPGLSPASCCALSPTVSTTDTPFSALNTPVDSVDPVWSESINASLSKRVSVCLAGCYRSLP